MILSCKDRKDFYGLLDQAGLKQRIDGKASVLIKINLARTPRPGHPRTDPKLLADLIEYVCMNGGTCAIAESANGYLKSNMESIGLGEVVSRYGIDIIDLDQEEPEMVLENGEEHFLPKCLKNYDIRIGMPVSSKRPQMIFSNNVKLFVGAVPRSMYQVGDTIMNARPRVHINLHRSVANIFSAIQKYAPFEFFINGGTAMEESIGEFMLDQILIGNDAVELDRHVLQQYFGQVEKPEYLDLL